MSNITYILKVLEQSILQNRDDPENTRNSEHSNDAVRDNVSVYSLAILWIIISPLVPTRIGISSHKAKYNP